MKIFSRQTINTFIVGLCVGITAILTYMLLTGNLPWLRAAGVGTGAPDVNARYLDGYGTAITTSAASKVLVTDGSGYLPDNSVDTGAIVDGTVSSIDIADGTITNTDISASAAISASKIADGSGSGLDADLLDGQEGAYYVDVIDCVTECTFCSAEDCWANVSCPSGYLRVGPCYFSPYNICNRSGSSYYFYNNGNYIITSTSCNVNEDVQVTSNNQATAIYCCRTQ